MNPGVNDGHTGSHYDIGWNIDNDAIKYDYIALLGKINGMSGDGVGLKVADCSGASCSWTDNKETDSDWDMSLGWDGTDLSEMKVPRDWDGSDTVDSDEFSTDQDDDACFTFALVNTNTNYVWASYPNQDGDGSVSFTECVYWSELNDDIDDVFDEGRKIDDASQIPEFSTLLMPVASVMLIVGWNNFRRKTS